MKFPAKRITSGFRRSAGLIVVGVREGGQSDSVARVTVEWSKSGGVTIQQG